MLPVVPDADDGDRLDVTRAHHSPSARIAGVDARIWLVAAVLLGAWARISGVGLGWFMVDQVRDAFHALGIANGTAFPLLGPQSAQSSVSITGPAYYYLIALPYAVSADPLVASWFSVLLSIGAVVLVGRIGTEMFGRRVGAVAALLYATHPFAVINGLAVWNPGVLPLFCLGFVLALWRYCERQEAWRLVPTLILLAFVLNLHLTSGPLLLLLPLAWAIYRPPIQVRPLLLGLGGAALFWVPYLVHEVGSGFAEIGRLLRWAGSPARPDLLSAAWKALVQPFLLPAAMQMPSAGGDRLQALTWFHAVQAVAAVVFVCGIGLSVWRLAAGPDRRRYAFLLAWFVVPFLPIPLASTGVLWYYFDVLYPVHALAIAILAVQLTIAARTWRVRPLGATAIAAIAMVVGGIVVAQAWYLRDFFREIRTTGVIRATADMRFDIEQQPPLVQETMALHSKRALASALATRLGVDSATLESRGHGGAYWQLREDRGMLLANLAQSTTATSFNPSTHYTLLRDDFPLLPTRPPTLQVGPYGIWATQPLVRDDSWRVTTRAGAGWSAIDHDASAWRDVILPARMRPDPSVYAFIPYSAWGGHPSAFRGALVASSQPASLWMVVSIREKSLHHVPALFVNGVEIRPADVIVHRTLETNVQDNLFDITAAIRPGDNVLAFMVEGADREFDLDVYEVEGGRRATR